MLPYIGAVVLVVLFLSAALRILNEYERGVIFRLGRVIQAKGPGLIILIPVVDKMVKVSMRLVAMDVDPQDVITRDNVSVKVNAVIYFRVIDPIKAIVEVEKYIYAISQLAQTTLRSVCGQAELDELLSAREKINAQLQEILDTHTDPWGIKVATVELKHIDLPQEMQRAMAKQAEAERERRAKVINAEGEFQAADRLAAAAKIIDRHPTAIQLRYLQTMREMSAENNTTTVFPLPLDLFRPFIKLARKSKTWLTRLNKGCLNPLLDYLILLTRPVKWDYKNTFLLMTVKVFSNGSHGTQTRNRKSHDRPGGTRL
jgi:regulator of protease activity HflC (stomatin/prohibitin superfamily)